ncbi:MAG: YfhO family protein [Armatimonadetes bacterium]|nr:YfhO family protein [Armatimonadota bacterium]
MSRRRREKTNSKTTFTGGREGEHSGERRGDVAAVVGVVLLHLLFFWRAATLGGALLQSDICYQFEPLNAFMHETLRAGRLPLWTPYLFCGYPIAAEGQIATFYPPALLLGWLLPSFGAVNWQIVSHTMLAAIGMYALGRRLGLTPFGAWLGATVFSFSGYLFAHLHHVGLIRAAAWLPVVLLFVDRAWHGRALANGALAGAAWAACALCGHPQTLFFISLAMIFWLIWKVWSSSENRRRYLGKAVGLLALVWALGLGLSAVQLLLTAELQRLAPHGEMGSLEYVTSFSLLPKHLLGLVAPNWQGTPAFNTYGGERYYWEYVLYIGLIPLLLALFGSTRRQGRIWVGVALVSLLFALAEGNPLYQMLRFVPGFAHFRAPARYVFLFTFAAALLAGWGWERLRCLPVVSHPRRVWACAVLIGILTIADLWHFDRTLAPLADPQVLAAQPRVVEEIQRDSAWGRSLVIPPIEIYADWSPPEGWAGNPDGWLEARVYLPADVPQSFELRIVGGYAGFVDPRHAAYFEVASAEAAQVGRVDLYSMVGTRYFVTPPGLELPDLPSKEVPPFRLTRNEAAFSRAFVVSDVMTASNSEAALAHALSLAGNGELRHRAVAEGLPQGWQGDASTASILGIEEKRPEHIFVRARADGNALVVLNERWDPGWVAAVDGKSAPLVEVNSVIMGVPIAAGEYTVEFSYRPEGLIAGRLISLASLAVLIALVAVDSLRDRRRPQRRDG